LKKATAKYGEGGAEGEEGRKIERGGGGTETTPGLSSGIRFNFGNFMFFKLFVPPGCHLE
jgi:hypothetical protein